MRYPVARINSTCDPQDGSDAFGSGRMVAGRKWRSTEPGEIGSAGIGCGGRGW